VIVALRPRQLLRASAAEPITNVASRMPASTTVAAESLRRLPLLNPGSIASEDTPAAIQRKSNVRLLVLGVFARAADQLVRATAADQAIGTAHAAQHVVAGASEE